MLSRVNSLQIVALRNEKGSYNLNATNLHSVCIVALRNEKGSYNNNMELGYTPNIVALRNEKGSYNYCCLAVCRVLNCSTAK